MASDKNLTSFIGGTFRSIWALELLCYLRKQGEERSAEELVESLRASDLVIRRSLEELVAAGLISVTVEGRASYAPATPQLDQLAGAAEEKYAKIHDAVRRIIIKAASPGLAAFADAFRLGGDK